MTTETENTEVKEEVKAAPKDTSVYTQAQQSVFKLDDEKTLEKFNKKVIEIHKGIND